MNENPIKFALLVAFGIGFGGASAEPAEIDLTMIDYKFVPDRLSFQHGVHYRLRLVNKGRQTHEFTAPVFFASAKIDNPNLLNREHTEILMQPGETKDLFLTPRCARNLRSEVLRPRLVRNGGRDHRSVMRKAVPHG